MPSEYSTACPTCGQVNNLSDQDLGVLLNCGACGQGFIFGEEIVKERRAAEKKRRAEVANAERLRRAESLAAMRAKAEELAREKATKAAEYERLRESQRRAEIVMRQQEAPEPVQVSYAPATQLNRPIDVRKQFGKYGIICANLNCGFVGAAKKETNRSSLRQLIALAICTLLGVALCFPVGPFVGFFFGLIIALLDTGKIVLICPKCGVQVRDIS